MKLSISFGIYNAIGGLAIGAYLALMPDGDGLSWFVMAAPLAAFLTGAVLWRLLIGERDPITAGRLVVTGLLTGTVSHYIAFILMSVMMNICYWSTGGCTGSLGDPPATILAMIMYGWGYTFFSLLMFGWITGPLSVLIGFLLRKFANR